MADEALADRLQAAASVGMATALWAKVQPDGLAVADASGASRSWNELNANANRVARILRTAGLKPGDAVALLCSNRCEFVEILLGALRVGLRLTPINLRLGAREIAYIVEDCEARALFTSLEIDAFADLSGIPLRLAIGCALPGFEDYQAALAGIDPGDISSPSAGTVMLYTSGTTGRPKGVSRPVDPGPPIDPAYDRAHDLHLCTGPAYHAAPLFADIRKPLVNGVGTLLMDKWDAEQALETIAARGVTHSHMVPIMFQRLLALPDAVRSRVDTGSLKLLLHGAAPCPHDVKRAMIAWLGPVIREYYAGSEGGAGIAIDSAEWLAKPGSVGRRPSPDSALVLDDRGEPCAVNVAGTIYLKLPPGGFVYHKDPEKTAASQREGYFSMGDIGHFDADDYLYLTGRSAETIISGGVNIYPQEIDNAIISHPAVADVCTIGIPNAEWGEEVRSLVQLGAGHSPTPALADDILGHARATLASFKLPRQIDFVDELPRSEAGKILRGKVRERFWQGRARQI